MTATLRPLDPPHKGLRNLMSQVSLLIGQTEFDDPRSVATLQSKAVDLFHLLEVHALEEETHVLAQLEERVPGAAGVDLEAHEVLERQARALRERVEAFDGTQSNERGQEFLLDFTAFQADYLRHMLEEERVTEPLVREHFSDEELIADQIAISQEMAFADLLLWFRYIAPARRVSENAQVLVGFHAAAPPEAFAAVREELRAVLPPEVFDELMAPYL